VEVFERDLELLWVKADSLEEEFGHGPGLLQELGHQ
jgi:hypothetical protein